MFELPHYYNYILQLDLIKYKYATNNKNKFKYATKYNTVIYILLK